MPRILYNRITKGKRSVKNFHINPLIKLILVIAVIGGFYLRSCWFDQKQKKITFHNKRAKIVTNSVAEVRFVAHNNSAFKGSQAIFIQIYSGDILIDQHIDEIYMKQFSKRKYLKVLKNFVHPIPENEKIDSVHIEVYKPSIFN